MSEKISIVNASNYQIFPGDSQGSMMVEDEFQPDGDADQDLPKAKRKKISKMNREADSEEKIPLTEKVIHIDTR